MQSEPIGSLYDLHWVRHHNSCCCWYISRQKVWPWFLTPQGYPRSKVTVPIESLLVLHVSAPGVQPRICHRFRDISSQRIVTLTVNTARSSKVKSMGSVYNLRWVPHRNCCRSSHISRHKSMTVILDPRRSCKVKSDGANRKPVSPTCKC